MHRAEMADYVQRYESLRSRVYDNFLEGETLRALREAGFGDHAGIVAPHLQSSMRVRELDTGQLQSYVVGDDGNERMTSDASPMTAAQLAAEMARQDRYAVLVAGTGASGGGTQGDRTGARAPAMQTRGGVIRIPNSDLAAKARYHEQIRDGSAIVVDDRQTVS